MKQFIRQYGRFLLVLSIMIVNAAWAGMALADTGGSCGDGVSWTLDSEGTLTIYGSGTMDDYYDTYYVGTYPWGDEITRVNIEEGVLSIGGYAFGGQQSLKTINISSTVNEIGDSAFDYCLNLTNITVSEDNPYFKSENGVLFNKTGTELILYPSSRDGSAYTIPSGVTTLWANAFYACNNLESITIPEGMETIKDYNFAWCANLTSVTLPASLSDLSDKALFKCEKLRNIYVASGSMAFSSIDGVLFDQTGTVLLVYPNGRSGAYTIPDGVTAVSSYAFYNTTLTGVEFPSSLQSIERYAFQSCSGLTEVVLPDGLINIKADAFGNCDNLASVVIPAGVTSINPYAFWRSPNLVICCEPYSDAMQFAADQNIPTVYLPSGSTLTLPDSTNMIGSEAFADLDRYLNIEIPASVTEIADDAFADSPVLLYVTSESEGEAFAVRNNIPYLIR